VATQIMALCHNNVIPTAVNSGKMGTKG